MTLQRSEPERPTTPRSRATTVFLDRDGTVNVKAAEGDYVRRPEDMALLPGAALAVRRFNEAGVQTVVVTNQRGVSLGLMSASDLARVHDRLAALLAAEAGAHLDAIYACIHAAGTCDCRKPAPGLLLMAARADPRIALSTSVMIGDAESDVEAGRRAGVGTIRLARPGMATAADVACSDLLAAADLLLISTMTGG